MMGAAPARFGHAPATVTRFGGGTQFPGGFHAPRRGPGRFHPQPTFNRGHHHHGFNFAPAVRFRYRYPLYYGGYYSPSYWDWWGSSYDSNESSQNDYAQRQMLGQIDDLSQEVQRLRQEKESSQTASALAATPAPRPTPVPPQASVEPPKIDSGLPVVLVFFDKKIQEIKNYAVMNEMLVVFDGTRTRKIPLRDVDLAATMKLNDERGVDFQIPN
jgi:hypothetical protein